MKEWKRNESQKKEKEKKTRSPCPVLPFSPLPKNKNKNKKQKEKSGNPSLPALSRIFPPLSTVSHPDLLFLPIHPLTLHSMSPQQ